MVMKDDKKVKAASELTEMYGLNIQRTNFKEMTMKVPYGEWDIRVKGTTLIDVAQVVSKGYNREKCNPND